MPKSGQSPIFSPGTKRQKGLVALKQKVFAKPRNEKYNYFYKSSVDILHCEGYLSTKGAVVKDKLLLLGKLAIIKEMGSG